MEFKVIFIGFALHCVLNTVLICKSIVSEGQGSLNEAVAVEEGEIPSGLHSIEESSNLKRIGLSPGEFKALQVGVASSDRVEREKVTFD